MPTPKVNPAAWGMVEAEVLEMLRKHFRPEFLNRSTTSSCSQLTRDDLGRIVDLQLTRLESLLHERHLRLEVTQDVREFLADQGYDPVYGARPLKRVIQRELQNPIALEVLEGAYHDGDTIRAELLEGQVHFATLGAVAAGAADA